MGRVSPQCCVCLLLYQRSTRRALPFIFNTKMLSVKRFTNRKVLIIFFHLLWSLRRMIPRYLTPLLKNFTWSFAECPALSLSVQMQRRGLGRIKISLSSKWKILATTFLSALKGTDAICEHFKRAAGKYHTVRFFG